MIKRYYFQIGLLELLHDDIKGQWVKYNDIKDNLIEWHSVEDELPELYKSVLAILANGAFVLASYRNDNPKGWCHIDAFARFNKYNRDVTYWAYLPKPPKGANND